MNILEKTLSLRYQDCISCHHRTEFTCVKCGYCYSCHWKRDQIEQVELRDKLKYFYVGNQDDKQKPDFERKDEALNWRTLDVLGQPAEPICNYYGSHHKSINQSMVQDSADANIQRIRR
jgi:hypothetical protein